MVTNYTDSSIFGTPLTISYVEERIVTALKTEARFGSHVKLARLGIKQGFFSVIVRLSPDWTLEEDDCLPKSFILKIPTLVTWKEMLDADCCNEMFDRTDGAEAQYYEKMALFLRQTHNAEVSFYEYVKDKELQVGVPKTFVCEKISDKCNGLIVMEDKGENSYTASLCENVTVDEAKEVLSALAAIHSFSIRQPEFLTIGENGPLRELLLQFEQPKIYADGLKVLPEIDPDVLGNVCKEIAEFGDIYSDIDFMDTFLDEIGVSPVLAHADLWLPNVLWVKVDGRRQFSAIIDWQDASKGWAAEDIGRFLTTALSGKDRRENQEDLLMHYYQELENCFGERLPFSYEQFKTSYIRILPYSLAINLPMYGPNYLAQMVELECANKEEMLKAAKEKAIHLAEDLLHYLRLNKKE